MEWVDESFDIGQFAAGEHSQLLSSARSCLFADLRSITAAFRVGPSVSAGKTYPVCSPRITPVQLAEEYHRATGEETRVQRLSLEEAGELVKGSMGESAAVELTEMFSYARRSLRPISTRELTVLHTRRSWLAEVPEGTICSGAMKPEDDMSFADLGVKASSLSQFLKRTGFSVPKDPHA